MEKDNRRRNKGHNFNVKDFVKKKKLFLSVKVCKITYLPMDSCTGAYKRFGIVIPMQLSANIGVSHEYNDVRPNYIR